MKAKEKARAIKKVQVAIDKMVDITDSNVDEKIRYKAGLVLELLREMESQIDFS